MSNIAAVSLRRQAVFAVLVACLAGLVLRPGTALAAETGPFYAPGVDCNSFTNTIRVYPRFGAGDSYKSQWLSYRVWALDVSANTTFWLSNGGQFHAPYLHIRVGEPRYDPVWGWQPGMENTLAPIGGYTFPPLTGPNVEGHGRQYQVIIQYAWWSPNLNKWLFSSGVTADRYYNINKYGSGEMAVCYL